MDQSHTEVWVGNLNPKISDQEIKKFFIDNKVGVYLNTEIHNADNSKKNAFAYVAVGTDNLDSALKLSGRSLAGRSANIKRSARSEDKQLQNTQQAVPVAITPGPKGEGELIALALARPRKTGALATPVDEKPLDYNESKVAEKTIDTKLSLSYEGPGLDNYFLILIQGTQDGKKVSCNFIVRCADKLEIKDASNDTSLSTGQVVPIGDHGMRIKVRFRNKDLTHSTLIFIDDEGDASNLLLSQTWRVRHHNRKNRTKPR